MSGTEDRDRDMLAAEFVLGTLEGAQAREAERLARADPGFARLIADWERRLSPLAGLVADAAPPPELWGRISASVGDAPKVVPLAPVAPAPKPPPVLRRVWFWQAATAASLALAAALGALLIVRAPPPPQVALLVPVNPTGGSPAVLAVRAGPDVIALRPAHELSVPSGKDLELWAMPPGATAPRSLGVLSASGQNVPGRFPSGTQLLVSLEPKGGSPSGQPTGPVLWAGRLASI